MTTDNRHRTTDAARRLGFTLIELLVVIGIIAVLMAILLPTISRMRQSAQVAASQSQISSIEAACERYRTDYQDYPGPLSNLQINSSFGSNSNAPAITLTTATGFTGTLTATQITASENLLLGLCGGLVNTAAAGATPVITYDPSLVGKGPASLNNRQPKRPAPYFDAQDLSWDVSIASSATARTGKFDDQAGSATDTVIPEFVDKFSDPLPVLYMRATKGAASTLSTGTAADNTVFTNGTRTGQYDLSQVIGYTDTEIGVGKDWFKNVSQISDRKHGLRAVAVDTSVTARFAGTPRDPDEQASNPRYWNGYAYMVNPDIANTPRKKDSFILISAGRDRIYGTFDDITNGGDLRP